MTLLVVFLVVTLGLTLWLGYQALAAARSHRQTAEGILRDYARIAAWEFSRRSRENLDRFAWELFDDVPRRIRGRRVPGPEVMEWEMDDALRRVGFRSRALEESAVFFRWSVADSSVTVSGDPPRPSLASALAALLGSPGDTVGDRRYDYRTAPAGAFGPDPFLAVYWNAVDEDGSRRYVYGALLPLEALEGLFQDWYQDRGLLPEVVAGTEPNDSLLHLTVRGPSGERVLGSEQDPASAFLAETTLPPEYGSLVVEVAIWPDAAEHLIIGGLPRSRLPLLLALIVLALGVGVAALFQLRREHELARLREDFISGVSHEFRTPLTQIRMFTDLLADGKLETQEERRRSTQVIRRESRRLTHLVENTLQFARGHRGGTPSIGLEEVVVDETVRDLMEAFAPLVEDRDASLEVDVEPELRVGAQRGHLHQMLANLLDNALKYGPRGQTVRLRGEGRNGWVRLSVEDEGPGIPRKHRERIWEAYRRLERDLEGPVRGSGIGLSVVADMAREYGGKAWVEDASGEGARFVVELPGSGVPEEERS